MTLNKLLTGSAVVLLLILGTLIIAPAESRTQPAAASDTVQECPADTAKGSYHVQGYDKQTGEVVCGFTFFNECPYFAGAEADTPECEKGKPTPEQLEPWKPEPKPAQPQAAQCGGK